MLASLDSSHLSHEVAAILTYDGSFENVLINYTMVVVTLYTLLLLQPISQLPRYSLFILISSVFLVTYQIGVCLVVQCVGISIVWSAYSGMIYTILHDHARRSEDPIDENILFQVRLQFLGVLSVWMYYLFVEEIITTIAHILAFILGMSITYLYIWICPKTKIYEAIDSS